MNACLQAASSRGGIHVFMRFSEAIDVFTNHRRLEKEATTCRGYDLDLRQFCLYTRNPLITQIYIEQVVEYLNAHKELGWSQNTIMIKAVCLTQFFKFWAKKGYPTVNYELIPHVKREYVEPKIADRERLKKLIDLCDKHPKKPFFIRAKAMILLTADTGCRNSEICSFPLDVDTETCEKFRGFNQYSHTIKTKKTCGKKPFRKIFWYDETNKALKKWKEARAKLNIDIPDQDALFIGLGGQGARLKGRKMTVCGYALILRKLSLMAGIPYLNAHSMRHLFGNDLGAQGANNSTISDLMGHASLASSFIYTHLNDKQLSDAHIKYKKQRSG